MRHIGPIILLLLVALSIGWAIALGRLERADFTFCNGTEIQSVDPALVTGVPEGRIINGLSEGLYRLLPARLDPQFDPTVESPDVLKPQPAIAESCDLSEDKRVYTFHIRADARWTDGTPVTAEDFVWSWRRFLHPEIACQYVYQLTDYVVGASAFHAAEVSAGDRVEIELRDRLRPEQPFPSGTMLYGILKEIQRSPAPEVKELDEKQAGDILADWRLSWIFVVEVKPATGDEIRWEEPGVERRFCRQEELARPPTVTDDAEDDEAEDDEAEDDTAEACHQVFPHFASTVGIRALDERRLQVTLINPTAYFLHLASFYPLYPVNRRCVEEHGYPAWTKPENIVTNGPYRLKLRRIRDRIRLEKNPTYWNAKQVQLQTIDALAVNSQTTALNMYLGGQADWIDDVPQSMVPELRKRPDWVSDVKLGTYFYRLNVQHPVLRDVRVRRALNLAIDKQQLCASVVRAGEVPARSFCPPGLDGYQSPECPPHDAAEAQQLLAAAGYPGGQGFPRLEILYNTHENHRTIAEVIQQQWNQNLGIQIEAKNREWGVYLDDTHNMRYDVSRAAWIGDYLDPNTFLDMFVTGGQNNYTGWSNSAYDRLIATAKTESDPAKRMQILQQAEVILLDEMPIIPIYFYVSKNLVRPTVTGFRPNLLDLHDLQLLGIDRTRQ